MQARRSDMASIPPQLNSQVPRAYMPQHKDEDKWHKNIMPSGGRGISHIKVLWSICTNDRKSLKPETRGLFVKRALTPGPERPFGVCCKGPLDSAMGAPVPPGIGRSHTVRGMLTLENCDRDRDRRCREGNLSWSALPNIVRQYASFPSPFSHLEKMPITNCLLIKHGRQGWNLFHLNFLLENFWRSHLR
ncbi:hypothetical protein F5Y14DRAFT_434947 [Nemania sp. NC0429]|nr:hypothetical protein F5Y14DRAFT_434947 [Nemania sp. NC0429]